MAPQLLRTIDAKRLQELLTDPGWCLQPKYDGIRAIVQCTAGQVTVTGRSGRPVDLGYVATRLPCDRDYSLDGEYAYGCYFVFDDLGQRERPYVERLAAVRAWCHAIGDERIRPTLSWTDAVDKTAAYERAQAQRIEGVVLKRLDAPWREGTAADRAVRFKFFKRAEVALVDVGATGRKSATMIMYADGDPVIVGRLPLSRAAAWQEVNEAVDNLDTPPVAEVQYLYATEAGQLYQPSYCRIRYDKADCPADCAAAQLIETYRGEMDGGPQAKHYPAPQPPPPKAPAGSRTPSAATARRQREAKTMTWFAVIGIVCMVIAGFLKLLMNLPEPKRRRPMRLPSLTANGYSSDGGDG